MSEVIGPYRIERELGRGGMGVVYAGVHQELGRRAAIKVLLDPKLGGERFLRECEGMGRLDHPGIVRTYEAGTHNGCPYLAMELVEGSSLKDVLATTGPWPSRKAAELGVALCEAMAHVHAGGLLHRDLKPENILIDHGGQARITDFGLVRGVGGQSLTATGTMVGTPAFMPPEQAEGAKKQLGPPADVYGLGATLFTVLTGRPPFEGASPYVIVNQVFNSPAPAPSSLQANVDPALDEVILRCLAKEPEQRYSNAQALGEVLARYLAGELQASSGRRPLALAFAGLLVMALSLGGVLVLRAQSRPTEATRDPQQIAADYRRARGDAGQVAKWLEDHAGEADPALVREARRELAGLSWSALDEIGSTEDPPPVNDMGRLRRYRALVAWIRDHSGQAKKSRADAAKKRARLWRSGSPVPVLAFLGGESRAPSKRWPLVLGEGRVLGFGSKPALLLSDLGTPPREVPFVMPELGPGDSDKPRFLNSAARVGDRLLVVVSTHLLSLDPKTLETRARLSLGPLRGTQVLPLPGGRALVTGELKGPGGGWTLIPPQPWSSEVIGLTQREDASVRAGLFDAERGEVYLAVGSSDTADRDYFLHRYRYAEGTLEFLDKVKESSAGYHVGPLPQGRIVVGLNRKNAEVFQVGPLAEQAPIELSLTREGLSVFKGLVVQCLGTIALPDGGLLLSCNSYGKKEGPPKNGWLAYFEPDQLAAQRGELVYPRRIMPLPFSPRSMVESADGSLIFLGTDNGYLAVLPRFELR